MMKITKPAIVLSATLLAAGCASSNDPSAVANENDKTVTGAVLGGIIGGVIANNTGNKSRTKTALGVAAGAMIGGGIGQTFDEKERKLKAIADERDAKAMQVERLQNDMLRVSVSSEASFDFGKSSLKAAFKPTLNKVAGVLREDSSTRIRVVGHTDSVGSDTYNLRLSEQRAQATSDYLIAQGVRANQVQTLGRGESEPRASNSTAEGRAQNRRVEIYLQGS